MDIIVQKLSEIESAASSILEAANLEKKDMEQQSQINIKAYDQEIDQQTTETLHHLKETLDAQMEQELAKLAADTENAIQLMQTDYDENHEVLAGEILKKVLER